MGRCSRRTAWHLRIGVDLHGHDRHQEDDSVFSIRFSFALDDALFRAFKRATTCYLIYTHPGTRPISATLSNLYMVQFDMTLHEYCKKNGILYRRYSDDILLVCPTGLVKDIEKFFISAITSEKLTLNARKTERHSFDPSVPEASQYLGFNIAPNGTTIRPSSLSRQWRKLRKSLKSIRKAGERAIAEGTSDKIFTKKLRRRFAPVPVRNFSSYARRSAKALNEPKILKQAQRLERFLEKELATFKKPKSG
jgi:RNA-directed DNA polymerase